MGLETKNDRLKAIGLFNKYATGTSTGAGGGGSLPTGLATEAQQINQLAQAIELLTELEKKPWYYIDITKDTTGLGAGVFPFRIDVLEVSNSRSYNGNFIDTDQYFITPTVVNNMTELITLWNSTVTSATMVAREGNTVYIDVHNNGEFKYMEVNGVDSINIGDTATYGVMSWRGAAGTSPANDGWYEDTSLLTSNLDFILAEVERIRRFITDETILATEDKQDDIITAITNLQAVISTDYEVLQTYGRDSVFYINYFIEGGSESTVDYTASGNPAPTLTIGGDQDSIQIDQANSDHYVQFDINKDYSSINNVEMNLNYEVLSTTSGAITDITIELINTLGGTILDSVTVASGFLPTQGGTTTLSYDNSVTQYSELSIRITPVAPFPFGDPSSYFFDGFEEVGTGLLPNPEEATIKKLDKYEDNVLVSTDYLTKDDVPYTLLGDFIPDDNVVATELLVKNLIESTKISSDLDKLTSHNTFAESLLSSAALSDLYTNFKELSFTVTSGTVDVIVGAGAAITYPIGPVVGNTYTADNISDTSISIDRTNGDYLVTVKS